MGRSHKPRKRYVPKRVDLDPMGLATALASLLQPEQRADLVLPMNAAFLRLRLGQGTHACWANLADAMNVAERLAGLGIANDHAAELQAAHAALASLHARNAEGGTWVMRGTEIAALEVALELHQIQLDHCTQGELAQAITTVQRVMSQALAGNASPRAHICMGGLGASTQEAAHV